MNSHLWTLPAWNATSPCACLASFRRHQHTWCLVYPQFQTSIKYAHKNRLTLKQTFPKQNPPSGSLNFMTFECCPGSGPHSRTFEWARLRVALTHLACSSKSLRVGRLWRLRVNARKYVTGLTVRDTHYVHANARGLASTHYLEHLFEAIHPLCFLFLVK